MNHKQEITSIDDLQFMWKSCKHHWEGTWADYQNLFEGRTCLDIGIWKGLLNAMAKKHINCETKIGVEPSIIHRTDCKKFNPHTKLYPSIEELPDNIYTDIILLHGVIWLMGTDWTQEMKTLLSKVSCKHVHIRNPNHDRSYAEKIDKNVDNRFFNNHNMEYYKGPTINDIVEFFDTENYKLIDRKDFKSNNTVLVFEKQS